MAVTRKRKKGLQNQIEIECDVSVQEQKLVYIGADGIAYLTLGSDQTRMPARFYVIKKTSPTTAMVAKELVEEDDESEAGTRYYVSTTEEGGIQSELPTEKGHVWQHIAIGIKNGKRYYSITDQAIIRG